MSLVKNWLSESFQAAKGFDGSEVSEERLFYPLSLFDDFVRAHADDEIEPSELERKVSEVAFPDHPLNMPVTIDGFLDIASEFYDRLTDTDANANVYALVESAGGIVQQSEQVFVKTDEGQLNTAKSDTSQSYEVKTEPRLAMLIAHLRNDGVNGQSIYMDDLVITQGQVDDTMMREHPYSIVQIPRLDIEIAVCDQVGETTFVKKGITSNELWDYLSKEQLKAREDIIHVDRHSDEQWWSEISSFLSGNAEPGKRKVNIDSWSTKKPKLDRDLAKITLLAHRQATGDWLSARSKDEHGKEAQYKLQHGVKSNLGLSVGAFDARLSKLGTSIAKLNKEISEENGLDYTYKTTARVDTDLELAEKTLLEHRLKSGTWLSVSDIAEGQDNKGSYRIEYGPKEHIGLTVAAFNGRLVSMGTTIDQLNEKVSKEHGLDYKEGINVAEVKAMLHQYRIDNKAWLSASNDGKIDFGPEEYHGIGIRAFDSRLRVIGLSISDLNAQISEEHGLDYEYINKKIEIDIGSVKKTIMSHFENHGVELSSCARGDDGKVGTYKLKDGPYKGMKAYSLEHQLKKNDTSIAELKSEIIQEYGSDFFEDKTDIVGLAKQSLQAYHEAREKWLTAATKTDNGDPYAIEFGPEEHIGVYVGTLNNRLRARGSSISLLNKELKAEKNSLGFDVDVGYEESMEP